MSVAGLLMAAHGGGVAGAAGNHCISTNSCMLVHCWPLSWCCRRPMRSVLSGLPYDVEEGRSTAELLAALEE
jgi:hypothetical protein